MSLTTFVEKEDVREQFRSQFQKPTMPKSAALKAPPISKRYTLIGTAFDYLLRFYIKRLNPAAIVSPWQAEQAINSAFSPILKDTVLDGETGELAEYKDTEISRKVRALIDEARQQYTSYLSTGIVSGQLLNSVLCLAQIDPIMRAGYIDPNLGKVYQEDIEDLTNLIEIVSPETFTSQKAVFLNPTFGKASSLVGGADADVILDDLLIDIKTIQKCELQLHAFHQLLGYYILNEMEGIGEEKRHIQINRVGIYFSRFGYLCSFKIGEVTDESTLPSFIDWFKKRAQLERDELKSKFGRSK